MKILNYYCDRGVKSTANDFRLTKGTFTKEEVEVQEKILLRDLNVLRGELLPGK